MMSNLSEEEISKLKNDNNNLKEKLNNYIPRRRIRRVYKELKKILEKDIENENKKQINILVKFVNKIEKEGKQIAGQEIKFAIEHLLSIVDIGV